MSVRILRGDVREVLPTLADESVHCVVTSPPYWGLRDYGVTGQIGLEATPQEYVEKMVAVFREVRRVLRDEGTLWLNLGDSYSSFRDQKQVPQTIGAAGVSYPGHEGASNRNPSLLRQAGLKHKDLIGIPWRVAFALQADGWYLRQDIIWAKPNPMPESVRDRCTKAHEYIFLLAKSERYYYDANAIAERAVADHAPGNTSHKGATAYANGSTEHRTKAGLIGYAHRQRERKGAPNDVGGEMRNKRSVWTVATQPYSEAHFATFPPALIEPCILAGCPESGTVLDPFGGSGTTGLVAEAHGRDSILIELNQDYAELAERRIFSSAPLFAQVSA